jgi:hypothetical protein
VSAFCSLIVKKPQIVQPNTYTALRFDEESTDAGNWHASNDLTSQNSALIIPKTTAVGLLAGLIFWAPSDATQLLHRFTRDPFDPEEIDSTATNDIVPTVGQDFHVFTWPMTVRTGQPLALMVCHNASEPVAINLAEFKVWVP